MCRFKSAIILKDRVYIPDYNSHSDMLNELGIKDTQKNAEKLFVRAELVPKNNDIFEPVDNWTYIVDQDILPDWYVAEYDKQRMIDAVKAWAKDHIHQGIDNLTIQGGGHYCKNCTNLTIRGGTVDIYGGTACMYGGEAYMYGGTAYMYDGEAYMYGGEAYMYGGTAYILGGTAYISDGMAYMYGGTAYINGGMVNMLFGCIGIIPETAQVDITCIKLYDNSTLKDCRTNTIYKSGDWQYKTIDNGGDSDERI